MGKKAGLEGKVALVTGGSRGIGQAIALRLAEEGADVAINYQSTREQAEKIRLNKYVMMGNSLILGTPHERVKLLKAGADGKLIEKLYVEHNNFKIVSDNVLLYLNNDINIRKKLQPQIWTLESQAYLKEINPSISEADMKMRSWFPIHEQNEVAMVVKR